MQIKATIKGTVPSKSNCYKVIKLGNKCSLGKSKALKDYEKSFFIQLPPALRGLMIDGYFELYIDVFYPSQRSDLDNSLKGVLDCLQMTKTIKNDNKCIKIVAQKAVDKDQPRIEFEIKPL